MSRIKPVNVPMGAIGVNEGVYVLSTFHIGNLEGKLLTFIDASISDPVQRKALKDLLRPMVWDWAIENNMDSYYELKEKKVGINS